MPSQVLNYLFDIYSEINQNSYQNNGKHIWEYQTNICGYFRYIGVVRQLNFADMRKHAVAQTKSAEIYEIAEIFSQHMLFFLLYAF